MCPTYEDEEGGDKNTNPDNAEHLDILKYEIIIIWSWCCPEVEKGVEDGKELPRKFLRLAESFQVNHTRYVAFCENLSNHPKMLQWWWF